MAKEKTSVRGLRAECYPPKVAIRVRVPADAFLSSEEEVKKSNKKAKGRERSGGEKGGKHRVQFGQERSGWGKGIKKSKHGGVKSSHSSVGRA